MRALYYARAKKLERLILEAEEKSVELEYQLFLAVREQVKTNIDRLQTLAKTISAVDVLQSLQQLVNGINTFDQR